MVATSTLLDVLRRILRRQMVATAVIVVLGIAVGLLTAGQEGLWGALLGSAIAVVFIGTTSLSLIAAAGRAPHLVMLLVMGLWIVKMIIVLAALLLLRGLDFYNQYVLAGVLVAVVLAGVVIDIHGIMTARMGLTDAPTPAPVDAD